MKHGLYMWNPAACRLRSEPLDQHHRNTGPERREYDRQGPGKQTVIVSPRYEGVSEVVCRGKNSAEGDSNQTRSQTDQRSTRKQPPPLLPHLQVVVDLRPNLRGSRASFVRRVP